MPPLPASPLSVTGSPIPYVSAVQDPGIFVDSDLGLPPMFGRPYHAALPLFTSFIIFAGTSPTIAVGRSST
jgi:hypothetical protein